MTAFLTFPCAGFRKFSHNLTGRIIDVCSKSPFSTDHGPLNVVVSTSCHVEILMCQLRFPTNCLDPVSMPLPGHWRCWNRSRGTCSRNQTLACCTGKFFHGTTKSYNCHRKGSQDKQGCSREHLWHAIKNPWYKNMLNHVFAYPCPSIFKSHLYSLSTTTGANQLKIAKNYSNTTRVRPFFYYAA